MKKIGLTGGIATGKSTVSWMFQDLGAEIISADQIAHEVIKPHSSAWKELYDRYGSKILLEDGVIDREELAAIIFHDEHERKFVEAVIHPRVQEEMAHLVAQAKRKNQNLVLLEIPLLFESKMDEEMDAIIVVRCDKQQQLARCQDKFGIDQKEAKLRIQTQKPLNSKIDKADFVIDTAGSKSETFVQVRRIYSTLNK